MTMTKENKEISKRQLVLKVIEAINEKRDEKISNSEFFINVKPFIDTIVPTLVSDELLEEAKQEAYLYLYDKFIEHENVTNEGFFLLCFSNGFKRHLDSLNYEVCENFDDYEFVSTYFEDVQYYQKSLYEEIMKIFDAELTPKEKEILVLRFGFNGGEKMTHKEIGKIFNVREVRIRQIEQKSLRKLHSYPSNGRNLRYYLD